MPELPEVRIDLDSILEQWEANGGDEVWVEFAPDAPAGLSLLPVLEQALCNANAVVPDEFGTGPFLTVAGGSVLLKWPPGEAAIAGWLEAFARDLGAAGLGGLVRAVPLVRMPDWIRRLPAPAMTAYASYDQDVAGDGGLALCQALTDWVTRHGHGETHVHNSGMNMAAPDEGIAQHLQLAAQAARSAGVSRAAARPAPMARGWLAEDGMAVYQAYDPGKPAAALIGQAREAMLTDCAQARLALAAVTRVLAHGWDALGRAPGLAPAVRSWSLRKNSALWARFVPDACGMLLLTSEHIARASDLSRWTVTEVAYGRFLAEAPALPDWFTPSGPPPELITSARSDLGPIIAPADLLQ